MSKKADLSWRKSDYLNAGLEVPDELLNDEAHTEGEIMTDDDIIEWVAMTERTFYLIRHKSKERYEELHQRYQLDIQYLEKIGKITSEEADIFLDIEKFEL